ncbi:MAG: DegQ family serine endoprotease [Thermodesulfobacteriota bacterium]|nr:MAG: DegQ family serine endoprotease [Thermodesulfobacteriota bacterium]
MNDLICKHNSIKRNAFVAVVMTTALILAISISHPTVNAWAMSWGQSTPPESFSTLAETVSPAVVNISTIKTIKGGGRVFRHFYQSPKGDQDPFKDFFDKFFGDEQEREFKQRSLGSGFLIDTEGYIVTNNHVIAEADKIKVKLNSGKEFDAKIIGGDPSTDIALIKIKADSNYSIATLGDSDALKVGEWIVAIGSPFGLEHTVTAGIVSAKGRVIGSGPYDDFIQTDASINPGNSGGPLINMKGEVIGINTAIIAGGQGIGFAVPVNMAKGVIKQLKEKGEVTRGWLGIGIQNINDEIAEYYGIKGKKGVLVSEVFPGDPANKAGVRAKDIILEVNGKKIETSRELTRIIAGFHVGEVVRITVLRNGKEKTFKVKIAKREEAERVSRGIPRKEQEAFGLRVSNLSPKIARRLNIQETKGVVVTGVQPNSQGKDKGIQTRDIIKEINHQSINTVNEYRDVIRKLKKGDTITMLVKRANSGFFAIKLTNN